MKDTCYRVLSDDVSKARNLIEYAAAVKHVTLSCCQSARQRGTRDHMDRKIVNRTCSQLMHAVKMHDVSVLWTCYEQAHMASQQAPLRKFVVTRFTTV